MPVKKGYTLIFLQMVGCPHCAIFEDGEWPKILQDTRLEEMGITMDRPVSHGPYSSFASGDFRPLPPRYLRCFTDGKIWGPAFILESPSGDLLLKDRGSDISMKGIEEWCEMITSA